MTNSHDSVPPYDPIVTSNRPSHASFFTYGASELNSSVRFACIIICLSGGEMFTYSDAKLIASDNSFSIIDG